MKKKSVKLSGSRTINLTLFFYRKKTKLRGEKSVQRIKVIDDFRPVALDWNLKQVQITTGKPFLSSSRMVANACHSVRSGSDTYNTLRTVDTAKKVDEVIFARR
jgi:hypothetical protein